MAENAPEEGNNRQLSETAPCLGSSPAHPTPYNRSTSVVVRARKHWQDIRKHIVEEGEAHRETRNKWYSLAELSKTMGHGVAEFFGVADDEEAEQEKRRQRWKERSKRMHSSVFLGGRKAPAADQTDHVGTASVASDNVFELNILGSSSGMDEVDGLQSSGRYTRRTPQPVDPMSRGRRLQAQASRQESRISVLSASRRSTRPLTHHRSQKEHVWQMAYGGLKLLTVGGAGVKTEPKTPLKSRSFSPAVKTQMSLISSYGEDPFLDDAFFDKSVPTSARVLPVGPAPFTSTLRSIAESHSAEDIPDYVRSGMPRHGSVGTGGSLPSGLDEVDGRFFRNMRGIGEEFLEVMRDRGERHQPGIGIVGKLFHRKLKPVKAEAEHDDPDILRPYFTYWVTFVQLTCFFFMVTVYGFAEFGFYKSEIREDVLKPNLAIESSVYEEQNNMWFGPRQADLIHLGAKYSPCMREDKNVWDEIERDRQLENKTACCVRNDGSGCVQTHQAQCSRNLASWETWQGNDSIEGRTSGSVCGLDYRDCSNPPPLAWMWPDDITRWPICSNKTGASGKHMKCEIVGRPCCIGIQGQCVITTREECTFRRGYFHAEAFLCSQVSCLGEVCGMMPFLYPDKPNQFYRLWTCLFMHAGIIPLLITVVFQVFIMRDVEKLIGWLRIGIIYIISGVAGSLSSAIFLPYHPEVGPTGSQFGLLACLFVEVIHSWGDIAQPWHSLLQLAGIQLVLFALGLLPWIDNYAHLVGFVFGFLLSFAMWPHIPYLTSRGKLISVVVCLSLVVGLFSMLVVLFYVNPLNVCPNCEYFNCIPFTGDFCDSMKVEIRRTHNDDF